MSPVEKGGSFVFLQPHLDDAALSCGAVIHALRGAGRRCAVVTLFAQAPAEGLPSSELAQALHREWGGRSDIVKMRWAEDDEAMAILDVASLRLPFLDAIYRRPLYESWESLTGPVHEEERSLPAALLSALESKRDVGAANTLFFAPLGVGGHVDHRHGFELGVLLVERGRDVVFYEDVPYVLAPGALDARLREVGRSFLSETLAVGPEDLMAQLRAVRRYRSQLPSLFGAADPDAILERHLRSRAASGASFGLRYWRLDTGS